MRSTTIGKLASVCTSKNESDNVGSEHRGPVSRAMSAGFITSLTWRPICVAPNISKDRTGMCVSSSQTS